MLQKKKLVFCHLLRFCPKTELTYNSENHTCHILDKCYEIKFCTKKKLRTLNKVLVLHYYFPP